jgi:protein phosphatase PTC7
MVVSPVYRPASPLSLFTYIPYLPLGCGGTASRFAASGASMHIKSQQQIRQYRSALPSSGTITPAPENLTTATPQSPYRLETGYALRPKRPSRPFPPPFVSLPSTSFSDPLTTHTRGRDRRPSVGGELVRGLTNGDDAILVSENYLGVNDGVGAWATKSEGHAA